MTRATQEQLVQTGSGLKEDFLEVIFTCVLDFIHLYHVKPVRLAVSLLCFN